MCFCLTYVLRRQRPNDTVQRIAVVILWILLWDTVRRINIQYLCRCMAQHTAEDLHLLIHKISWSLLNCNHASDVNPNTSWYSHYHPSSQAVWFLFICAIPRSTWLCPPTRVPVKRCAMYLLVSVSGRGDVVWYRSWEEIPNVYEGIMQCYGLQFHWNLQSGPYCCNSLARYAHIKVG